MLGMQGVDSFMTYKHMMALQEEHRLVWTTKIVCLNPDEDSNIYGL